MRLFALALGLADPVELHWHGDLTCPQGQFERSLAAHLDGAPAGRPVRLDVEVRAEVGGPWVATLTLDTADGRSVRRLAGSSCAGVSEAAAFVAALVVDPSVIDRATPPTDTPAVAEPPPAPPAEPPPAPPAEPLVAPASPPPRPRGFLRLAGGLDALALPGLGGRLALAGGLLGRRWRVELDAHLRLPTLAPAPTRPDIGGRIGAWALGARGCGVLRPAVLELPLCAGLEAGQAFGAGDGLGDSARARVPWLAAVVGPALAWSPRPRFALWLGADLVVPLLRGTFIADELLLHRIGPVGLRAALGLELRLP